MLKPKPKICLQATFCIVCLSVGMFVSSHMAVAFTDSVGKNFFFKDAEFKGPDIKIGAYINTVLRKSETHLENIPECDPDCMVTKIVSCMGGMILETRGKYFFCDEVPIGVKAKRFTKKGERLIQFVFNGKIPKNKLFLTGVSPDSFDSRYWGFKDVSEVQAVLHPIF